MTVTASCGTRTSSLAGLSCVALLFLISKTTCSDTPCQYPAQCIPLQTGGNQCLGVDLDYTQTSLDLANDSSTLTEISTNLEAWSGLRGAPRCWDVIQPLLCAIYMPRCNDSQIHMYPRELCLKTREPCKIVPESNGGKWPSFLDCDQPHFTTEQTCTVSIRTQHWLRTKFGARYFFCSQSFGYLSDSCANKDKSIILLCCSETPWYA